MDNITALWAPEIQPPDSWLVPAVLYQDKISTFAPVSYLDDSDGRSAQRLKNALGDLYEPANLRDSFLGSEAIVDNIGRRLDGWVARARSVDFGGGGLFSEWADRVEGAHRSRGQLEECAREAREQLEEAEALTDESHKELSEKLDSLRESEALYGQAREMFKADVRAAKSAREHAIAPILARLKRAEQLRSARGCHSDNCSELQAEISALKAQMQAVRRVDKFPGSEYLGALKEYVEFRRAKVRGCRDRHKARSAKLKKLRGELEGVRERQFRPGVLDHNFTTDDLRNLPRELETIALGKIHGSVYDFLASSAGMWVVSRSDKPWAGSILGPRFVIEEIMNLVAEEYARDREDYVLMGRQAPRPDAYLMDDRFTVAAVMTRMLPIPARTSLEGARIFRERHQEEFARMRDALRTPIIEAKSLDEVQERVEEIRGECEEASSEIKRALRFREKGGLAYVWASIAGEVGSELRNLTIGAALSGGLMGDAAGDFGTAHDVAQGLVPPILSIGSMSAYNAARAGASRKRIGEGFQYTYQLLREDERRISRV
ncbi:hypothetical protein ACTXKL_04080 [Brachybacterium tyrofermentans]|uniref:hypothetical protein n=1 Tax=Brachybacterium tyrofermentans TaxID=47848 RepID=UPI003FD45319